MANARTRRPKAIARKHVKNVMMAPTVQHVRTNGRPRSARNTRRKANATRPKVNARKLAKNAKKETSPPIYT